MIIVVNQNDEIIQLITVGEPPEGERCYVVDNIPVDIQSHIFDYKYKNRQFILKAGAEEQRLQEAKDAKIKFLSTTCQTVIESGIDFNGEHYSLKSTDQINLSKLESIAALRPTTPLFYHSDGNLCRRYTTEEILSLSQAAVAWITYHTTYFNYAKAYIDSLTTIDEVAYFKYGMTFSIEYQVPFDAIVSQFGISFDQQIDDPTDYDRIRRPLGEFL